MSAAIEVLLVFTAWTLLLAAVYVGYRVGLVLTFKEKANAWTRGAAAHSDPAWVLRFHHAHLNCLENLPLYAAVVLGAYMLGEVSSLDQLAWVYMGARIAQSVVHVISTAPMMVFVRGNAWFLQLGILGYWLYGLLA